MTYSELFPSAVSLACEDPNGGDSIADYSERAPYLFANLLTLVTPLDKLYRHSHGLEAATPFSGVAVEMSDEFHLSPIFAPAALYYVAAMLVLDENESMSDKLFALYSDTLASIQNALPAKCTPITETHRFY